MTHSTFQAQPEHNDVLENIIQERLRQARLSFNLSLATTAISACISIVGAGLLLSGKLPEGSVTAAGGAVSSACCIRFAKDANDRLDQLLAELND
ncbi:MAG: hypothetical protein AAFY26_13560 [Cyanobacteria bacterium J06638_22]